MARMIPDYCKTESPGEEKLFKLLKNSTSTNDWTILHSLHIARHVSKAKGEADFVILIPRMGVLVLEVKSHLKVSVNGGVWRFGSESVPHESPFVQAERAMFSIRRNLIERLSFAKHTTFLNLCWFTELDFPKTDAFEWRGWQVLNSDDLKDPASSLMESFESGIEHLQSTISRNVGLNKAFDSLQIAQIVEQLRPNFEFALSEKVIRSERKRQLVNFVEEQFVALDYFSLVPRVIFKGPAGTGKSLLAIELAKRAVNQGRKVLLVCFNTLLAESLRRQYSHPLLEISTIDSLAFRIASLDSRNRLPSNPLDALKVIDYDAIDVPREYKVDQLIIDEAQDTLNEKYLGFLDSLVTEGLSKGNWVAFGDFDAQRIYLNADNIDIVRKKFGEIPVAPLSKNCRNVVQIGHFVEGVLPKLPKWSEFMRDGEHPNPTLLVIPPNTDMVPLLDSTISHFRKEHFSFDEIIVLTPMEIPNPSHVFSESEYSEKFVNIENHKPGRLSFSTISRFKGLDSSCVIALDLEQLKSWDTRNELLYVLFTRATDRLAIMANEVARNMLISSLGSIN